MTNIILYPDFEPMIISNSIVQYGNEFARSYNFEQPIKVIIQPVGVSNLKPNILCLCDLIMFGTFLLIYFDLVYIILIKKGVKKS